MASIGGNNDDPSSGMTTTPFFASTWEPIASLSHHESLGGSSLISQTDFGNSPCPDVVQNHGISVSSHLVQYPSDSSFIHLPKLPSFGSGSFSELVGPFGHTESCVVANAGLPTCALNENRDYASRMMNVAQSSDNHHVSEEAAMGASPSGRRRKRGAECDSATNFEGGLQKEQCKGGSNDQEEQEKRSRTDQTVGGNCEGKQATAKLAKGNCPAEEFPKDNYIHVRARRGQATNSHSLAERVRREKISERMKTLQELVPGCNKITGKAVMLDEIINYVQSLQQQVEFLSMKLATVNPELNIDIERIFSKDIFHLTDGLGGNSAIPGFNSGMNSHSYSNRMYGANMPLGPGTSLHFPAMSQPTLDSELQGFLHMGFNSSSAINHLAPNGRLKPDR